MKKPEVWLQNISFPICSSFQPRVLEGQLCYEIQLNTTADKGRGNELMMLLDYNEDRSLQVPVKNEETSDPLKVTTMKFEDRADVEQERARIQVETLSNNGYFGGGIFKMTDVKRMTAKSDFLSMSYKDRQCEVELFQDCKTKKLFKECNCVPWEVPLGEDLKYDLPQDVRVCSPKGRACIAEKSVLSFNCSQTCDGVHANIERIMEQTVSLEPDDEKDTKKVEKGNYKYLSRLIKEYKEFKKRSVSNFNFRRDAFYGEFRKYPQKATLCKYCDQLNVRRGVCRVHP